MNQFFKQEASAIKVWGKVGNKNDLGIVTIKANGEILDYNQIFVQLFNLGTIIYLPININKIPAFSNISKSILCCFSNKTKIKGDFTLLEGQSQYKIKFGLFPIVNKDHEVEHVLATFEKIHPEMPQLIGKNKYRDILNEIGHWTYFEDTRMLSISTETLLLLGISWQKTNINPLIGLILQVYKPDRHVLITFLKKPSLSNPVEFRIMNDRNHSRWLKCEIIKHNAGIWQGKIYDITEMKLNEERLKSTYLEQESFMYKSAHNLKGPASSISALTKIAIKEVKDATALEYLRLISESSERLEVIIKELLNINKIKQGYLEPRTLSLVQIVGVAIENLKFLKGFDEMEIQTEFSHTYPIVSDWNQVYSIFQNLIENAIKYKKPDKTGKLVIGSADTANGIKIFFADDGTGIPAEAGEKIFDMFYRASQRQWGSGLGLYIVKSALKRLGGDIKLTSHIGIGTTFTLFLPIKI